MTPLGRAATGQTIRCVIVVIERQVGAVLQRFESVDRIVGVRRIRRAVHLQNCAIANRVVVVTDAVKESIGEAADAIAIVIAEINRAILVRRACQV